MTHVLKHHPTCLYALWPAIAISTVATTWCYAQVPDPAWVFYDFGTQWSHGLQYAVAPCGIFLYFYPMEHWVEKGRGMLYITQHARMHTSRTSTFTKRRHSLVGSVLAFCVISHCAFSLKALFLSAWVRIYTKSHCNCSVLFLQSIALLGKIYSTVPRYSMAHFSTERQNHRNA